MMLAQLTVLASRENFASKQFKLSSTDRMYQADYLYFISGDPNTKVDFSFGLILSKSLKLSFEYNQTMFWLLGEKSKPFKDINFNPKFVSKWDMKFANLNFGIIEHHSNGKDSISSRSYNSSYVEAVRVFQLKSYDMSLGLRLRTFYSNDDLNKDIENYLGPVEISLKNTFYFIPHKKKYNLKFNLAVSPGGLEDDLFKYGYQKLDIIFDWDTLPFNIHAQAYLGYGESLIEYNRKYKSFRIGLSM